VSSGFAAAALAVCVHVVSAPAFAQGLVESATGNAMRPKFTSRDVPSSRGRFTFPSPYNTEAVRLTDAGDCGGSDCVRPVGYAYWSNINNHVGSDTMLVFLSLKGSGPTLFSYNKNTGETRNRGSIFAGDSTYGWATLSTGEGWYFSATRPNALYINEPGGARLFRYDVLGHSWETVFDASSQFSGKYIWQVHSSNDDRVHSFTVRDRGSYAMEGCAVYREDQRRFIYFARRGNDFDECQIDKSGKWLLIKEQLDGSNGEDNRVVDIDSNTERVLNDPDGAAGHSDMGYGYLVAEDNSTTVQVRCACGTSPRICAADNRARRCRGKARSSISFPIGCRSRSTSRTAIRNPECPWTNRSRARATAARPPLRASTRSSASSSTALSKRSWSLRR
jgi:hypothetical protein